MCLSGYPGVPIYVSLDETTPMSKLLICCVRTGRVPEATDPVPAEGEGPAGDSTDQRAAGKPGAGGPGPRYQRGGRAAGRSAGQAEGQPWLQHPATGQCQAESSREGEVPGEDDKEAPGAKDYE